MKKISRPSGFAANLSDHSVTIPSSPIISRFTKDISYEESSIPSQYPHRLSLYLKAPAYEITIEDFEELALARLERKQINN